MTEEEINVYDILKKLSPDTQGLFIAMGHIGEWGATFPAIEAGSGLEGD